MIKKTEKEICPCCGSDNLNYYDEDCFDDSMVYKIECNDCGKIFNEYYKMVYDGYSYEDEKGEFHSFSAEGKEV